MISLVPSGEASIAATEPVTCGQEGLIDAAGVDEIAPTVAWLTVFFTRSCSSSR